MTPDIVANAIVAAPSAGAAAGATDIAKSAIADAYHGPRSLIRMRYGDHSDVARLVDPEEQVAEAKRG